MTKPENDSNHVAWIALALAILLAAPGLAGKGGGKGSGSGGGGGGSTSGPVPVKITFRSAPGDGIADDGLGVYADDTAGSGDGVQAYLGTGGAEGDIFLRLANAPSRGLAYDLSVCFDPNPADLNDDPCARPAVHLAVDLASSIAVAVQDAPDASTAVVQHGLLGLAAGETVHAPMSIYYDFDNPAGPGQLYFEPTVSGKNPCKNRSLDVAVTRPDDRLLWTVSADGSVLACATLPGGTYSGQYLLPFEFVVEPL